MREPIRKTCNKCRELQPLANFYANKRMLDGLQSDCKSCNDKICVANKKKRQAAGK